MLIDGDALKSEWGSVAKGPNPVILRLSKRDFADVTVDLTRIRCNYLLIGDRDVKPDTVQRTHLDIATVRSWITWAHWISVSFKVTLHMYMVSDGVVILVKDCSANSMSRIKSYTTRLWTLRNTWVFVNRTLLLRPSIFASQWAYVFTLDSKIRTPKSISPAIINLRVSRF